MVKTSDISETRGNKITLGQAIVISLLAMLVLTLILFRDQGPETIQVSSSPQVSTIDSSGQYVIHADPDKVTLLFGYEVQKISANDSQQETAKVINAIKEALVSSGINRDDIKTQSYLVEPVRNYNSYNEKGTYDIIGYKTTHILKLEILKSRTGNLDGMGKYLDAAVLAGANRVDSAEFGLTDDYENQLKAEALKQASINARKSADKIAEGLGVSIKNLRSASQSYSYNPYSYAREDTASVNSNTAITPGQVSVTVSVSASFEFD